MSPTGRFVILIPYFGPWPFWMSFFLRSCEENPDVTWHLFGDHPLSVSLPDNVHLTTMSFDDYCCLVSKKLQINFKPASPYKLCDLKPALGDVHVDLLDGAEFWGFSDIDLVYGQLVSYFKPWLKKHNIISTHATRISGHFCLIRNEKKYRKAYQSVENWQALLGDPQHCFFDERAFSRRLLPHKNWPKWLRELVHGRDPLVRNIRFQEDYTTPCPVSRHPWINGNDHLPEAWYWREGVVSNSQTGERAYPYFHFYEWKRSDWARRNHSELINLDPANPITGWAMTAEGFMPLNESDSLV